MTENGHINYIEFAASDLEAVKRFYREAFGWKFIDYGAEYCSFTECGLDGGFALSEEKPAKGALVILYHNELEKIQAIVEKAGGEITVPIFSFPGGRRFHFLDPAGNELALWSDK